jgi:hypothetical protein
MTLRPTLLRRYQRALCGKEGNKKCGATIVAIRTTEATISLLSPFCLAFLAQLLQRRIPFNTAGTSRNLHLVKLWESVRKFPSDIIVDTVEYLFISYAYIRFHVGEPPSTVEFFDAACPDTAPA